MYLNNLAIMLKKSNACTLETYLKVIKVNTNASIIGKRSVIILIKVNSEKGVLELTAKWSTHFGDI